MPDDVQQFYDDLAASYEFIFADWRHSVRRQGRILRDFLEHLGLPAPRTVLDCTCGIGTQAIGLAAEGYRVHGTDLSPRAIERAQEYAQRFDLEQPPSFAVADLLDAPQSSQQYDLVLSCDNAVAHFMTDAALHQAITNMMAQCRPGGWLLISLRNYDAILENPPRHTPLRISGEEGAQHIVFQVWDWTEDYESYKLNMFILRQDGDEWHTEVHEGQLRALRRDSLTQVLEQVGLQRIAWYTPDESGYYQSIVVAQKAG